jgi:predicted anti-sigma-YlaC factor YlaD
MNPDGTRRLDASGQPVPGLQIDCIEVVELVTDYLEGVVDEATREEIEAHLVLCEPCQNYLDQMRATIDVLGHVPVDTLTHQAKSDLVAAFRNFRAPDPTSG